MALITGNPSDFCVGENLIIFSIVIEDDVWIAANAIILSGAKIGKGSIIGAGTVVSSEIPRKRLSNYIYTA